MPTFLVTERRAYDAEILIEAVDEEAAQALQGNIIEENELSSWADFLVNVVEVEE